jgi:hypothetical protein
MKRIKKLTLRELKKMVLQEKAKMPSFGDGEKTEKVAKKTNEVDADEYADSLENKIDYLKVLKIKENKMRTALSKLQFKRQKILNDLAEDK